MVKKQGKLSYLKWGLTARQAADYLDVSAETLKQWRWKGVGPEYFKVKNAVRYLKKDLDDYIKTQIKRLKTRNPDGANRDAQSPRSRGGN